MQMNKEIDNVSKLITSDKNDLKKAVEIITNSKYDTVIFKKTFNRYSDNIFNTDSKRANVYLAGGASPSSIQTQQYLLRNSALTAIANLRQDLIEFQDNDFIVDPEDLKDTSDDCRIVTEAFSEYLKLADPADIAASSVVVYPK